MKPEWRARTLRTPQYRSELDLVITHLMAHWQVSVWAGLIWVVAEPIGVHPRFHRRGFARTLLLAMLHRCKAHGATSAFIEPYLDNLPIHRACKSVGFQQVHTIHRPGKWVNQHA